MKTVKLGDICNLMTGGTPSKNKKEYFENGTIPWLVSGDIHKGEITACDGRITELGLKNSNARLLPVNSVMIALNGQGKTRATVALLRIEATCNQSLVSIYPKDDSKVLPEYIYWNLKGRYDELRRLTGDDGNDRRGLNMIIIRNIDIPEPPSTEEQRRVVERLDAAFEKIDRAIELTEKNIIGLQVLYETYFANLLNNVSGSTCLLEEVCAINSKLIDPKVSKYQDLLHVGGANIEPLNGNLVRLKSAKQENIISGKFIFDENMILYSKIRPYLKKVARPAFSGLCSADIYPLVPLENIRKDYLYYLLLSEKFTSYAISGSGRAGMPKVNRPYLFAYKFTLPTLKIQDSIIGMLDEISMITSRLKTKYELKKATLMTLKQSMLHQAFSDDGV